MKTGILGTGYVGKTLAEKLISMGHQVMIGTRNPANTLARPDKDSMGSSAFSEWHQKNQEAELGTFAQAASFGNVIFIALHGGNTMDAINSCNKADFNNKVIIDISNPLDYSKGFPPALIMGLNNTTSLGEEIQKTLAGARVVKTLNTINAAIMVDPGMINGGDHTLFICGNDEGAKEEVTEILKSFGWDKENVMDLGDITNARGTEAWLLLWARILGALNTGAFSLKVVR